MGLARLAAAASVCGAGLMGAAATRALLHGLAAFLALRQALIEHPAAALAAACGAAPERTSACRTELAWRENAAWTPVCADGRPDAARSRLPRYYRLSLNCGAGRGHRLLEAQIFR